MLQPTHPGQTLKQPARDDMIVQRMQIRQSVPPFASN
jgi:hypothetical protein